MTQPALIGIIPRRELWPIIKKEKWYHIPKESVPDNIFSNQYLAFYFPECFPKQEQYQIKYYAKVLKIDIKKRIKLFPDEPEHKNADKDYYQLHLAEIEELPNPILNKNQTIIIHIPTTKQKLFTAKEIDDLWELSPIEEKMYQALKKQGLKAQRQFYIEIDDSRYFLDFAIFCKKGKIDVECDGEKCHALAPALAKDRQRNNQLKSFGWHVLRFTGHDINHDIKGCLAIIKRTINNLGGLDDTALLH